jgi:hypothetical protein
VACIVAVGFEPGPYLPSAGSPPSVPQHLDREDLDPLSDVITNLLTRHEAVVVIHPSWDAEPSLQRVETVRSAFAGNRLVTYGTALPPLAGAVLVALSSAVAPLTRSAGALLAGLPVLEAHLLVLAWLARVTRLHEPAPSLWQHALSLLPGTAFGVSSWPEPSVRRLTARDPSLPLPRASGRYRVAAASRDGDMAWVRDTVVPALGAPSLIEVPPTAAGPDWWGTRRLVEVVAYPLDLAPLLARIDAQPTRSCTWCGTETPPGACAFCHAAPGAAVEVAV